MVDYQEKLILALETAKMTVWEWDFDNPGGNVLTDFLTDRGILWSPEKTPEIWFQENLCPEDWTALFKMWSQVLLQKSLSSEVQIRLKNSRREEFWILARTRYYWDEKQTKISNMVGCIFDITDLKKQELQINSQAKERESFYANASHELLTPLTALKFKIERALLEAQKPVPENTRSDQFLEALIEIDKTGDLLKTQVNEMIRRSQNH